VFESVFAFAPIERSEFKNIGRGVIDPHRQRTEIVERRDFDFAGIDRFKDAWQEGNSDAVGKLGVFEAEVANFAKHGATVGVTVGIPTR
jgi:hypothetical protein